MNAEDRSAALARCEAATEGPWQHRLSHVEHHLATEYQRGVVFSPGHLLVIGDTPNLADAEFIAHARTDLPAALAEIEHLEERLTKVTALLPRCGGVVRFTSLISAQCVKRVGHDGPCDNRYKEGSGG